MTKTGGEWQELALTAEKRVATLEDALQAQAKVCAVTPSAVAPSCRRTSPKPLLSDHLPLHSTFADSCIITRAFKVCVLAETILCACRC